MSAFVLNPSTWALMCGFYLASSGISFIMLYSEIKHRTNVETTFTNNYFKFLSITPIICGFSQSVLYLTAFIPGLCLFTNMIAFIAYIAEPLILGFYQLYRLYYCFSNSQIHSHRGYPKWVFIIMYGYGTFWGPAFITFWFINHNDVSILINSECGYFGNYDFYAKPIPININIAASHAETLGLISAILQFSFLAWDIVTLILYWCKIRKIKRIVKESEVVHRRIQAILQKIRILTIFYDFVYLGEFLCGTTMGFLYGVDSLEYGIYVIFSGQAILLSISYAIFLMLDHNQHHYVKFLRACYCSKLYLLYCCCRNSIIEQLKELDTDHAETSYAIANTPTLKSMNNNNRKNENDDKKENTLNTEHPESVYIESYKLETQTNNDGFGVPGITANPMELSVITETKAKHVNQQSVEMHDLNVKQ